VSRIEPPRVARRVGTFREESQLRHSFVIPEWRSISRFDAADPNRGGAAEAPNFQNKST
jgi:hypothetical protein